MYWNRLPKSCKMSCFRATVCKTVRPMLSDRCLSVLSVTLVHCGQMVGCIKMKLGAQVGLGPGHNVLDGDPAPPPSKGHSPPPNFRPISVVAKWLDGLRCHLVWRYRPRPRRLYVRWRPSSPPQKGGGAHLPNFQPISIVAKRLDASRCHLVWR